jgi:drug/metabolite transporter (DMT)-like permease
MVSGYERVQHPVWGATCMVVSVLCFTVNALLLKYLSSNAQISPWVSMAFRAIVGLTIIWVLFGRSGTVNFRRAATGKMLVIRGMFGVCGTAAYYFTIDPLGPGKATLISNTYVVMSAILAVWILKEQLTAAKLVGNVIAFIGLVMLIGISPQDLSVVTGYELLALFGALMAAATVIVIRQLTLTESSATIYASQCVFVLLGSLIPAITNWYAISAFEFGLLLVASSCASIGQLAMTDGFRHLTIAVGGAFQILVPVFIALGGVIFFTESFTAIQIIGGSLILAGCYGAVVSKRTNLPGLSDSK